MSSDGVLSISVDGSMGRKPGWSALEDLLRTTNVLHLVPGRSLHACTATEWRRRLPPLRYPAVRAPYVRGLEADDAVLSMDQLLSGPETTRTMLGGLVRESASVAQELGAGCLVLDLGLLPREAGTASWEHWFPEAMEPAASGVERTAESLERLARVRARWDEILVDRACRLLHEVSRSAPGLRIALSTPGRPFGLPSPDMLDWMIEDLGTGRVGYWHDTGRARALAAEQVTKEEVWLDRFGPHCLGVDLGDALGSFGGLPAGSGEVDFAAVRQALPAAAWRVVRIDPMPVDLAPFVAATQHLRDCGF